MNKNFLTIIAAAALIVLLPACRKNDRCCNEAPEKTCQTRYAYDECDACYELEANACEVSCPEASEGDADMYMINKF